MCPESCLHCTSVSKRSRSGFWEKHGIRQAGFWTTAIGESNQTLTYLIEWESLADREKKWTAFMNDPEWIAARAETEKDGPIVAKITNSILRADALLQRAIVALAAGRLR